MFVSDAVLVLFLATAAMASATPNVPSPQLFSLTGKNVLLTGASRGIGQACALALAQAGASVCLVTRDSASTASTLAAIPSAQHVVCDLSDLDAVTRVFDGALEKMGGEIHILVNCAGIQRRAPSVDFSEQDWDDVRFIPVPVLS
jgi:2-deoxy-D-gluconate 3-dehydrogenase